MYLGMVGIPFICISGLLLVGNYLINAWLNDGWGAGNIFLIANTAYATLQWILATLLFLEIDPWLKYMKFIRLGSMFIAFMY